MASRVELFYAHIVRAVVDTNADDIFLLYLHDNRPAVPPARTSRRLPPKRYPTRSGKLDPPRSRLYRGQILQENTRWKALAEIYTTPFSNLKIFVKIAEFFADSPRKL